MGFFSRISQSADLMHGMAARLGADVTNPILRNPDQGALDFRAMILRCSACTDQVGCANLQARCAHLENAPAYCLNKAEFDPPTT